jgi:hypothetical protein
MPGARAARRSRRARGCGAGQNDGVWSRLPGSGSCPVLKACKRVREPRARPVYASAGPGKVDQMIDSSEPVRWRSPVEVEPINVGVGWRDLGARCTWPPGQLSRPGHRTLAGIDQHQQRVIRTVIQTVTVWRSVCGHYIASAGM